MWYMGLVGSYTTWLVGYWICCNVFSGGVFSGDVGRDFTVPSAVVCSMAECGAGLPQSYEAVALIGATAVVALVGGVGKV